MNDEIQPGGNSMSNDLIKKEAIGKLICQECQQHPVYHLQSADGQSEAFFCKHSNHSIFFTAYRKLPVVVMPGMTERGWHEDIEGAFKNWAKMKASLN